MRTLWNILLTASAAMLVGVGGIALLERKSPEVHLEPHKAIALSSDALQTTPTNEKAQRVVDFVGGTYGGAQGNTQPESLPSSLPKKLRFNLALSKPEDLKIHQGDTISAGQIVADRVDERSRLIAQRQALVLELKKIEGMAITRPTAPVTAPTVSKLPPVSYAEEEAVIASANLALQQAQREFDSQQEKLKSPPLEESSAVRRVLVTVNEKQRHVDIQHRKIDAVSELKDLPPEVLIHEQAVLKQKESDLEQAKADLEQAQAKVQAVSNEQSDQLQHLAQAVEKARAQQQLAISKLQTAKDKRAYTEYEASVAATRRIEEHNQAEQNYMRQLQESEQHERDREFQVAQIQAKIADSDNQLSNLGSVKSPYSGRIQSIRFTGQNDKSLSVDIVLVVNRDRVDM